MGNSDNSDTDRRTLADRKRAKVWGGRPWADKTAKEILNDVSHDILRCQPEHVDDPADPSLSEVLEHHYDHEDTKAPTLASLLSDGLTYQEAVCWYWFRHCQMSIMDIYYSTSSHDMGGGVADRRNATRNIRRVLHQAAEKRDVDIDIPQPDEQVDADRDVRAAADGGDRELAEDGDGET